MTTPLPPLPAPVFAPDSSTGILDGNVVHLWLLDINLFTAAHYADAARIMSSSERERAQKFVRGKESYIASRWLLRTVLGRYMDLAPEAVEFLRTDKGKPFLPHSDIHFSLSHSGHWAVLAVASTELIGVDVEAVKATRDLSGIAASYYHPHEFSRLQSLTGAEHSDYFYRLWTLKEAFFKALGTGISAGLEKIQLELDGYRISAQIASELGNDASEWRFHQWALTAQDYCALACKHRQPPAVNWFDALSAPAFP